MKIFLSQIVIAVSVALIIGVIVLALRSSDHNRQHIQSSYEQLQGIMTVAVTANRLSEQVAELFILGEEGVQEMLVAERGLKTALDRLDRLVRAELVTITDDDEHRGETDDLERIDQMKAILTEIVASVDAMRALLREGRRDEAVSLFRENIENRLDFEFEELIEESLIFERREVEQAIADSALLAQRSTLLTIAVAIFALGASLAAGLLLHRALSRPIALLVDGAEAVGRGDLSHRIEYQGADELGHMSMRFNAMAAQLEEHRGYLLRGQATLEQKVRERTEQLREQTFELERANTRLKEVDDARIRFLADISHELRTPLTVLRGEAEVSLRGAIRNAEEYRETLIHVVQKAAQIGYLVDDLLFLARSEAGTLRFDMRRVPLQEILTDALLDSRVLARRQRIDIGADQPDELIFVRGDPHRLKQAFLAVLDNACKYSPPGTAVRVGLVRSHGHAELTIVDEGVGFTLEEREHAFDRFYRGKGVRGRTRGSGLGLPIAKWIVEKHNGEIRLSTVPCEGTELVIRLPLIEEA